MMTPDRGKEGRATASIVRLYRRLVPKFSGAGRAMIAMALLAAPLALPLIINTSRHENLAVTAALYALFAYSLFLVYHYGGMLSLAHGALWAIGAYVIALVVQHWGFGFWESIPLSAGLSAVVAVAVGIPAFRTVGLQFLIVTFAFGEFLLLVGEQWRDLTNGPNGLIVLTDPPNIGIVDTDTLTGMYFLVLGFVYLAILVNWLIGRSVLGRRMLAIRENQMLASAVGINVFQTKVVAFAASGALAGVAGALFQVHQKALTPDLFNAFLILQVFLAIILGGAGSLLGPLVGAFFVTFFPEFLDLSPEDSRIAYGVLLIIFVIVMPKGVIGLLEGIVGLTRASNRRALITDIQTRLSKVVPNGLLDVKPLDEAKTGELNE